MILALGVIIWVSIPQAVWIACNKKKALEVATETDVFQYRKRYGLHAMVVALSGTIGMFDVSIPQAVWIACNVICYVLVLIKMSVSIPQAVWIACNTVSQNP